ncbi:MAG: hypothetical protein PHE25_05770 [Candidatus Gracilibacteria bacterium]|nr:hypothetical protein [Candidatus Gracilibacteria bacterium]
MDKLFFKLFLIILLGLGAFYYAFPWSNYSIDMPFTGKDYKLGLDLQGGVELDYKVDLTEVQKEPNYGISRENGIIEGLKSIVDKRVEALKINDSVITTASYGSEKHIIVQIPLKGTNKKENDLNIKRAKDTIGKVMKIEFKEKRIEITPEDIKERRYISQNLLNEALTSKYDFSVSQAKFHDTYENIFAGSLTGSLADLSKKYFTLKKENLKTGIYKEILTGTGIETYSIDNNQVKSISDPGYWILDIKNISGDNIDFDYAFVSAKTSE